MAESPVDGVRLGNLGLGGRVVSSCYGLCECSSRGGELSIINNWTESTVRTEGSVVTCKLSCAAAIIDL